MISTKHLQTAEEKFYSEYFFFSYSSLNKLLHSPVLFYNWYVLRDRKDALEGHLVEGKIVHCLLLDEKMFDEQFIVMTDQIPGVSNKKIAHHVYKLWKQNPEPKKLSDYSKEILDWLQDNSLHQKLSDDKDLSKTDSKTGDQKRLDKVLTPKALNYFEYLKESENKDVIDKETLDKCREAVTIIQNNKSIMTLLGSDDKEFELVTVKNELDLLCKVEGLPFGLKGIVDNLVIDYSRKEVRINDLKTTGKTLSEFRDSLDYYKYWMQAAIYVRLVQANFPETKDFDYTFSFVVIDKHNQTYPFLVKQESMLDWQAQLDEVLKIAKYHYINKDYTLPYEFAMNQVTL